MSRSKRNPFRIWRNGKIVKRFPSYERAVGYVCDRTAKPQEFVWEWAQASDGFRDDAEVHWFVDEEQVEDTAIVRLYAYNGRIVSEVTFYTTAMDAPAACERYNRDATKGFVYVAVPRGVVCITVPIPTQRKRVAS